MNTVGENSQEKKYSKTREMYRLNVATDKFVGVGQEGKVFSANNLKFLSNLEDKFM